MLFKIRYIPGTMRYAGVPRPKTTAGEFVKRMTFMKTGYRMNIFSMSKEYEIQD